MLSSIPANYIRQWHYCPRIVYYMELTSFTPVYPIWVNQGERFHQDEIKLWQRRNLSRFGLEQGKVYFDYHLTSKRFNLHGIADMLVETEEQVYPVEFKLASTYRKKGGILQLAAYGLMAEEVFRKNCPYGFLAEGKKSLHKIVFTQSMKNDVLSSIREIQTMVRKGIKPDSPASINQCTNCEYLNRCNDRE